MNGKIYEQRETPAKPRAQTVDANISPKTGLPYKTTAKQRAKLDRYKAKWRASLTPEQIELNRLKRADYARKYAKKQKLAAKKATALKG